MTPVEVPVRLRDGTRGLIRDVRVEDKPVLAAEYERLSPESRFHRFLSPVPHLTGGMLHHLVDEVDFIDHVALGMIVDESGEEPRPVGIARTIRYSDMPDAADVAVTVVDDYQGRGVATMLLAELMRRRPVGVRRLITVVSTDNRPSLAMLRRLGPTTVSNPSGGVVEVEVLLDEPAQSGAAGQSTR